MSSEDKIHVAWFVVCIFMLIIGICGGTQKSKRDTVNMLCNQYKYDFCIEEKEPIRYKLKGESQ